MSGGLGRIMKKEVKELLTPATLVPIIVMAIIFGMMGNVFSGIDEEMQSKAEIGLVVDDPQLGLVCRASLNASSTILYNGTSLEAGKQALLDGGSGKALIYVPGNMTSNIMANQSAWIEIFWLKKGTGLTESVQTSLVDVSINKLSRDISTILIMNNMTSDPSLVLDPLSVHHVTYLNDQELDGITPGQLDTYFSSTGFVVPLIVMLVIIMSGGMVINSMGSEKENKTLETLLTLPVQRTWIVFGKLAGAAIVGLIVSFIYMLGLGYYYSSLTSMANIDVAKYGLTLDVMDYAIVGVSLFLALLCGLALCMILGIFTKNFKAAQTMVLPVTMLAMIPMFISFFSDFNSLPGFAQVLVFLIPFSHPMFAINDLLMGNYLIVLAGIIYMAIFAAVSMAIAVTLFRKDILLTGRVSSAEKKSKSPLINLILSMRKK